jgi:hypothetical protein
VLTVYKVSKLKDPGMAEAYYAVLEEECFNHLNLRLDKPFDDCIETALARTIESMEAMEFEVTALATTIVQTMC